MLRYSAAERNCGPIGDVLAQYLKNGHKLLEIASGTGQHATSFSDRFPQVTFQPSECDARLIHSIVGHVDHYRYPNLRVPLHLDVSTPCSGWALPSEFSPGKVDVMLTANLVHISSNKAVQGLFEAAGSLLHPSTGLLIIYGPFSRDGRIFPQSNVDFDHGLRAQNAEWGLRDTGFLDQLARSNGLKLTATHEMPANNLTLVFGRL